MVIGVRDCESTDTSENEILFDANVGRIVIVMRMRSFEWFDNMKRKEETDDMEHGRLSCRKPDSQSSEPGFESPFATVSKIGHFHSLN